MYSLEGIRTSAMWQQPDTRVLSATPHPLPVRLVDWAPVDVIVGDGIEAAGRRGDIKELRLRPRVADILDEESIELRVNDQTVQVTGRQRAPDRAVGILEPGTGTWFESLVTTPPIRQGKNTIQAGPSVGCWGNTATLVREIQLWVEYGGIGS